MSNSPSNHSIDADEMVSPSQQSVELPELDVTSADEATASMIFGGRPTSLVPTREGQDKILLRAIAELMCRNRQLKSSLTELGQLRALAPRWREQASESTHWEGCWQEHRLCALKLIEQLRANGQLKRGWISVETELPPDGNYLIADQSCVEEARYMEGKWFLVRTDGCDNQIEVWPTHWMPLPSPPNTREGE